MEAVALHAPLPDVRGNGTSFATAGCPRWKLVSKQATWGTSGSLGTASIAARLCG